MMLEKMNLTRDINKCYARLSWFVCCRYLDSCLRRCSQLFCSNNFALPNTNIDCETNWNTNQERNTDRDCDKYKCLTAVCADARSFFDPQTLHRQLLHVFFCRSIFLILFSTRNLDMSSTLHTSQIMTLRQTQILTQIQTQVVTQMQSQIVTKIQTKIMTQIQIQIMTNTECCSAVAVCWPWSWSDAARMQPGSRVERAGKLATNTKIHKYINTKKNTQIQYKIIQTYTM